MDERQKGPLPLLQMLFGTLDTGFFTIWAKHESGAKITRWYDLAVGAESLALAAQVALELDGQGYDVYVSTCPAHTSGTASTRITQGKVGCIPAFFMDCDVGKPNCPASKDELLEKLLNLPTPPRTIVDSGGGYHTYWPLAVPLSITNKQELDAAKKQLRGFANGIAAQLGYTGFDLSASEPARVLRVPGTHNHKTPAPAPVDVAYASELAPYAIDELTSHIAASTQQAAQKQEPAVITSLDDRQIIAKMCRGRRGECLSRLWNGQWQGDYKSQSEADIALMNSLAFYSQGDEVQMDAIFRQSGLYRAEKWDEMHGTQTYGQMTIAKALDTTITFYDPQRKKEQATTPHDSVFERFTRAYVPVGGYASTRGALMSENIDGNGEVVTRPLANFTPLITDEITRDDGAEVRKEMTLEGITNTGKALPPVSVPTGRFAGMSWVLDSWGADANLFPGSTIKDKVRFATQAASAALLKRKTVYTHTGWRTIHGKPVYLYHGGAVGAYGISVELGGSLSMYSLPNSTGDVKGAATTSMKLLDVLPPKVAIPLLAFVYLVPLCEPMSMAGYPPSFVFYLVGRSGTRKSTSAALALNHFGAAFNSKRLPASFNDTANSVQSKAFLLKDMPLLVDDFKPESDQATQRRKETMAQQLARAWGDGAERGRLQSDGTQATAKPPRGLGFITGEDVPGINESGVARNFVVELKAGDVPADDDLTALQDEARQGILAQAMRGYIEWLIPQYDALPDKLSALFAKYRKGVQEALVGSHSRQPEAVAWLLTGFHMALEYWVSARALDDTAPLWAQAQDILLAHSAAQAETLREEDPVRIFMSAMEELRTTGEAIVLNLSDPKGLYPHEECIGFEDSEYIYLMPGSAFGAVQEHLRKQGLRFPLSSGTLWRRMADQGLVEPGKKGTARNKHIPGFNTKKTGVS